MPSRPPVKLLVVLALVALAGYLYLNPAPLGRLLVGLFSSDYEPESGPVVPTETAVDGGAGAIAISLETVAEGFHWPTDVQFPPGIDGHAVVLEKGGVARWLRLDNGVHGKMLEIEVLEASEEGLLGLAFHPAFRDNGRFYLNYVLDVDGVHTSRVEEWTLTKGGGAATVETLRAGKAAPLRVIMDVQQPYQNHNAGQLAFGPDGYLYIGWGDGGFRDDPEGHGQNPYTFKGSMLRVDVDIRGTKGEPYAIPGDNPFVGKDGFRPEVYAYGLRNPWRYSFDDDGRLIVADVGQDAWEEIDIVEPGDNLGWRAREGFACYAEDPADCKRDDLVNPVFVYGRETGGSITGGLVYRGSDVPALRGHYVFGDFVSGRLMAIRLPEDRTQRIQTAINLGKWPVLVSAFGRDPRGELYVVGFGRGELLRIKPGDPDSAPSGQPQ